VRVLHVAASYHPSTAYGGPIVSMHQAIVAQVLLGAEVLVLTTDADGIKRLPLRTATWSGARVDYHRAMPLNSYGVSPGLWAATVSEARRYDIIHLHGLFLPSTTVGLWSGYFQSVPLVVSPHGALMRWALNHRPWRKRLYTLLDRMPLRNSLLHATSEQEADDLRALGFCYVTVVPNGVDVAYFAARATVDVRAELRLAPTTPVATWIGRFDAVKNLEVLVDATRGLGVHLLLAGDWETDFGRAMKERVRQQSREDVHFLGYLAGDRKRALLQQANVYAHPSLMESYGNSIVEALASGCPVVASTGTPWRSLDRRGAGRWVNPSVEAFRDAILAVVGSDPSASRSAAVGLAAEHAWPRRAEAMLAAYQAFREGKTQ
jgi:glycosyltransferase involved in cell wall biosynthesis